MQSKEQQYASRIEAQSCAQLVLNWLMGRFRIRRPALQNLIGRHLKHEQR